MMPNADLLQPTIHGAEARAKVLSSLDDIHAFRSGVTKDKQSPIIKKIEKREKLVSTVDVLLRHHAKSKTGKVLMDYIRGKSVVLENIRGQKSAASKRSHLKKTVHSISRKWIRDRIVAVTPSIDSMMKLHGAWNIYMRTVVSCCQSKIQLHTRLNAIEKVGAKIVVLDVSAGVKKKYKGQTGIIAYESSSCYYLLVLRAKFMKSDGPSSTKHAEESSNSDESFSVSYIRIAKRNVAIGFVMPISTSVDANINSNVLSLSRLQTFELKSLLVMYGEAYKAPV